MVLTKKVRILKAQSLFTALAGRLPASFPEWRGRHTLEYLWGRLTDILNGPTLHPSFNREDNFMET